MEINLPEKLYYSIGEVSKALSVNTSLLRYWEKEFDILNPKKTVKGTRKYSSVDIKNLKLIYNLLKVRGFTIEGAKEKLKTESKKIEIVEKLEKIKSRLEIIEKEL
ncbi:MAG: MerR family transcriptional regulator [Bacteroidota bacterium]|jgi:DNA-binding transcriptional MerR regulator|nr:MerR family transcriptional regulator [Bacteroidota bacterium]MEC8602057.1 MerR family transcriptional regulator [Bacteroidota bacterium]